MIQDFTHVQYFAICLKDFSPSPPSRASHTPPKGFAHCTVLFLLKNPAHKQDKWFKNNPHNKNKWGRGWRSGKEVGGGRERACILSFRHASEGWRRQQQSRLAFDLCKAPGVWVCHLKVFFSYTMIPKEEEKETSCHMRRDESCERDNQPCSKPPSSSPSCPHSR